MTKKMNLPIARRDGGLAPVRPVTTQNVSSQSGMMRAGYAELELLNRMISINEGGGGGDVE
jgi:hypothetical protein